MNLAQLLLGLLAFAATAQAAPREWHLQPFTTWYVVHSSGLEIGKLEQQLRKLDEHRYSFRVESYATGIAALLVKERTTEESLMRIDKEHIIPLEYHFNKTGGKKPQFRTLIFDRASQKIISRTDRNMWQFELKPNLLDNVLYQLIMVKDVHDGQRELTYNVVDRGEIKSYTFAQTGEEVVNTPLGEFRTIKLERLVHEDRRATTIWSAPTLNYLPVRIDNTDRKGRTASAVIQMVSGIEPKGISDTGRRASVRSRHRPGGRGYATRSPAVNDPASLAAEFGQQRYLVLLALARAHHDRAAVDVEILHPIP